MIDREEQLADEAHERAMMAAAARSVERAPMNGSRAYFKMPGVSSHALIEMTRSPLHCWAKYLDPAREDEEPTAAMRFGTLVHALTLTPATFADEFVLADAINRRTHQGKADHAALVASGKLVVSRAEYAAALAIVKAIKRHPVAGGLLETGEPEQTLIVRRESPSVAAQGAVGLAGAPTGHRGAEDRDRRQQGGLFARGPPARLPPVGGLLPDAGQPGDRHARGRDSAYLRGGRDQAPPCRGGLPDLRAVVGGGTGFVGNEPRPVRRVLDDERLAQLSGRVAGAGCRRRTAPLRGRGGGGRTVSGDRPRRRKGAAAQTPPLSDAQRRLVAGSRALWVKSGGFVENGMFGTRFGASAKEAAVALESIGYWHDPFHGVYRRPPATLELLKKR